MGFVKKAWDNVWDKVSGNDARDKAARQAREEAARQARDAAELEAAKTAGGSESADVSVGSEATKSSSQKKKLKGGKKGLSISRASGSGINI